MHHFSIFTNRSKDTDGKVTDGIVDYIASKGGDCIRLKDIPLQTDNEADDGTAEDNAELTSFCFNNSEIPANCECLLVLGGDGTIIEASKSLGDVSIPIVGINLGTLGFLSVVEKNKIYEAIDRLFEDDYRIENRMLLSVSVFTEGTERNYTALNDVTITRSGLSRMICTDVYINDELVGSYSGDGCLVATPTGSTGYNLSAGGPIIVPESELMCFTPICPHTLYNRSIIVSGRDEIKIVIGERRKSQSVESFATIDGQTAVRLNTGDYIRVIRAEGVTRLIRFSENSYFGVLHSKLKR